jgi:hypothetical protein
MKYDQTTDYRRQMTTEELNLRITIITREIDEDQRRDLRPFFSIHELQILQTRVQRDRDELARREKATAAARKAVATRRAKQAAAVPSSEKTQDAPANESPAKESPADSIDALDSIRSGLAHFNGTESLFPHWTDRLTFTDGVKYLAEKCGAFWLIDIIASYQHRPKVRACGDLQIWTLDLPAANQGRVTCKADTHAPVAVRQRIQYTDFPLPEGVKLYVRHGVLMLPSEN